MTKCFINFVTLMVTILAILPDVYTFECKEVGRFADPDDSTCKAYVLCVQAGNKLVKQPYTCTGNTIFDAVDKHCSAKAECKPGNRPATCDREGNIDNVNDGECRSYYYCKHKGDKGELKQCVAPLKYDSGARTCSLHYVCPRQFTCKRRGRFPDSSDQYNKHYFLCSQHLDGSFVATTYTCPKNSLFDGSIEKCYLPKNPNDVKGPHQSELPSEEWDHLEGYECTSRGNNAHYYCDANSMNKCSKI